jgi:DNA-binding response OmpR family regulator
MAARILIVDDEPHIRKVTRITLEGSGYEVGEASTGEGALELMSDTARWDAILLDERMPGIDGLETLRRMRTFDHDTPVMMVTAFASIELAVEAMKLGATDFVRKPITPETLRAAVDGALVKARGALPPASSPEPHPPAAAREGQRPAPREEVWLLNGFHITSVGAALSPTEHRFEVTRRGATPPRQVSVRFEPGVVARVSEEAERPLEGDERFWRRQAARALAHYVWEEADVPADGRLVVTQVTGEILKAAREAAG